MTCIAYWVAVKFGGGVSVFVVVAVGVAVNVSVDVSVDVGDGKYLSDNESRSGLNQMNAMMNRIHTPAEATPRKVKDKMRLVGFSCLSWSG